MRKVKIIGDITFPWGTLLYLRFTWWNSMDIIHVLGGNIFCLGQAPGISRWAHIGKKNIFKNIYSDVTISARTVSRFRFFSNNVNFIIKKQYNNKYYLNKWEKKWKNVYLSSYFFPWRANGKSYALHFFFIGKLIKCSFHWYIVYPSFNKRKLYKYSPKMCKR